MAPSDVLTDESTHIELTEDPLDLVAATAFLHDPEAGGISVFVGTTRLRTGDRETVELTYDCYRPMALREMAALADEARRRWPVRKLCILHRLATVPVGEASVCIGVATPHRAEAFEACRYLIDTLKRQVPIWKKEIYADGRTEWVQGAAPPDLPGA